MTQEISRNLLRTEAKHYAHRVLDQLDISALPVDPFAIAREHDIRLEAMSPDATGTSGCLIRAGDNFGIGYAQHVPVDGFIRFTVAHELGHYFLPGHPEHLFPGGKGIHKSNSGFTSSDPYELAADFFAAALLMPENLFRTALKQAGNGFAAIEKLARQCRTSLTATGIRFAQYTYDPVAVIMSDSQTIDFCFLSDSLDSYLRGMQAERYKKGRRVPRGADTARFHEDPTNIESAKRHEGSSHLAKWFDGAPEVEMDEDVVGLGDYGKVLTILFTEEALDDEEW
jgi:hypothetical protein